MKMIFSKHKSPKIMTDLITLLKWRTCFIIHTNPIAFYSLNDMERKMLSCFYLFDHSLTYKVRDYILWRQRYEKDCYNCKKKDLFLIHIFLIYRYNTQRFPLYFSFIYLQKTSISKFKN